MKKIFKAFVFMTVIAMLFSIISPVSAQESNENSEPIKIMCIGDSITHGSAPFGNTKVEYSYRYPLWKSLIDNNINFEFVGSINTGFNGTPDYEDYKGHTFNNRHQAYWGWTIQAVNEALTEPLKTIVPDIAIIYLGTNNPKDVEETPQDKKAYMKEMVEKLRAANPNIKIILGELFQEWLNAISMEYRDLAKEMSTEQSPIVTVKRPTNWISDPDNSGTCTNDWVHTNAKGDKMLADEILPVLLSVIGTPLPTEKPIELLKKPKAKNIDDKSKKIKGTAKEGNYIVAISSNITNTYSAEIKKGKFTIKLNRKPKAGEFFILIAVEDLLEESSFSKDTIVYVKPTISKINKVKAKSKIVKGKASKGSKITVTSRGKTFTGKANKKGAFKVRVKNIKKGAVVKVRASVKVKLLNKTLKSPIKKTKVKK